MENLTDVYEQIAAADAGLLEKQASMLKIAEEEDAAGRIMARGFADELTKIAGGMSGAAVNPNAAPDLTPNKIKPIKKAPSVKVKPPTVGGGATGPAQKPAVSTRPSFKPPV